MRGSATAAVLLCVSLLLAGCSETAPQGGGTADVVGSNTVQEYPKRSAAVSFSGPTVDGSTFRSSDYRGRVLVVNFWYAGCPPCRAEAPTLQKLWSKYRTKGVQFIGINVRDEKGPAEAFDRDFTITYPSILDVKSGDVQYAFSRDIPANAVPTTLVLDQRGRVAARIVGKLQAESILSTLIDDTLAGKE